MKRIAVFTVVLLLPVLLTDSTDDARDGVDALLRTIDLSDWDDLFRELETEGTTLPSEYLRDLTHDELPPAEISLQGVWKQVFAVGRNTVGKIALLLGLAVLGTALNGFTEQSSIGENAQAAFRILFSGTVLVTAFAEIYAALRTVQTIDRTTEQLLPVMIGFLTLSGMENTAALLPSTHALLSDLVLKAVVCCAAPLAVIGGVLTVLDTGGIGRIVSVGRAMQRAAKWVLGTVCSLFLLITALRTVTAGSADGLLLRTTKLAAGSIPAVGSLLSESVDTAFQCLRFVRNALGLTGCMVLLSVVGKPILSTVLSRCSLRVSAMLTEPLAGKPYADLLRGMGDTLHVLMLCELSAVSAALLVIAPVFGAGGAL